MNVRHPSPLRYPGGKTALAPFLAEVIRANGIDGGVYAEPYAGGAGAALKLLFSEVVSRIYINDLDVRIYSFWRAVLDHSDEFISKIESIPLTVAQWKKQKAVLRLHRNHSIFEVGFAAFYLNRCNRSGVLNAGPIGGLDQTGNYKIDARFNTKELSRKIEQIALYRDRITVKRLDGVAFLQWLFSAGGAQPAGTFVYMDPPYFKKAERLYWLFFREKQHSNLAAFLNGNRSFKWIISYDDTAYIRRLYKQRLRAFRMPYSVHTIKAGKELIISSPTCILPKALVGQRLAGKVRRPRPNLWRQRVLQLSRDEVINRRGLKLDFLGRAG